MSDSVLKIASPHTDAHYMTVQPLKGTVEVKINGDILANTDEAMVVTEFARQPYDPVLYIPRSQINMAALAKNTKSSVCPLKGEAVFFDFGELHSVAWSYEKPVKQSQVLQDLVAFYPQNVKVHQA